MASRSVLLLFFFLFLFIILALLLICLSRLMNSIVYNYIIQSSSNTLREIQKSRADVCVWCGVWCFDLFFDWWSYNFIYYKIYL